MVTRVMFPQEPGEWIRATEYDALAAHIEEVTRLVKDLLHGEPYRDISRDANGLLRWSVDMDYCIKAGRALEEALKYPPPNTLARRDLLKQAEG